MKRKGSKKRPVGRGGGTKHNPKAKGSLHNKTIAQMGKQGTDVAKTFKDEMSFILTPKMRDDVMTIMYARGRSGLTDMPKQNKHILIPNVQKGNRNVSRDLLYKQARGAGPMFDILFTDMHRPDVQILKNKAEKNTYFGTKENDWARKLLGQYDHAFTVHEQQDTNVVITVDNTISSAGNQLFNRQTGHSDVRVLPRYVGDDDTVVHEIIHARRAAQGEAHEMRDIDKEEIKTTLETLARSRESWKSDNLGYYGMIPNPETGGKATFEQMQEARKKDKILVSGSLTHETKGRPAVKRVEAVWQRSELAKASRNIKTYYRKRGVACNYIQGAAESEDRYFLIVLDNGNKIDGHVASLKTTTTASIISDFKDSYSNIRTIYEWRDGKKYKIYGR